MERFDGRLISLGDLGILEGYPERGYETIVDTVVSALNVPVAMITVIDDAQARQFFKAHRGLRDPYRQAGATPLSLSVCDTVRSNNGLLAIPDMLSDPDFSDHPAISELGVHAYLGHPFHGPANDPIGALCAIDHAPREWLPCEIELLSGLAALVTQQILLRASLRTIILMKESVSGPREPIH